MKPYIMFMFMLSSITLRAQFSESTGMIKASAGYSHDFPGLNGITAGVEYSFPVTQFLEGGIGVKHADMEGYPRSPSAFEYTKASTIDFDMYWAPLKTENQLFRIGLGYSFSVYNIQRSFPLLNTQEKTTSWPTQHSKGMVTGINAVAEYEHRISTTKFSIGIRGALYKAYAETKYLGAVVGYEL